MQYAIRDAHQADIPELISIFREAVSGISNQDYSPRQKEVWSGRGTPERFGKLFGSGLRFLLAEDGQNGIGFASISQQGFLHSLFVVPSAQKQGVARDFLNAATHYAQKHNANAITAEASITALPFFQRMGFEILKEQEVVIDTVPLKNYCMRKTL